jgi:hypothetical protein
MKTEELEKIINNSPFRPFALRVSSGTVYNIRTPRDIGAPKHCRTVFYSNWATIDVDSITAIMGAK